MQKWVPWTRAETESVSQTRATCDPWSFFLIERRTVRYLNVLWLGMRLEKLGNIWHPRQWTACRWQIAKRYLLRHAKVVFYVNIIFEILIDFSSIFFKHPSAIFEKNIHVTLRNILFSIPTKWAITKMCWCESYWFCDHLL